MPNNEQNIAANLLTSINSNDPTNAFLINLNSGNLNLVSQNAIALSSSFNNFLSSSSSGSNDNDTATTNQLNQVYTQMASLRTYLVEKVASLSVSDTSSMKVISSALYSVTQTTSQVSTQAAVIY